MQVRHEPTQNFGRVNAILPLKALEISLAENKVMAQQAVTSWQEIDGREWSVTGDIPYDRAAAEEGRHMSLA